MPNIERSQRTKIVTQMLNIEKSHQKSQLKCAILNKHASRCKFKTHLQQNIIVISQVALLALT